MSGFYLLVTFSRAEAALRAQFYDSASESARGSSFLIRWIMIYFRRKGEEIQDDFVAGSFGAEQRILKGFFKLWQRNFYYDYK